MFTSWNNCHKCAWLNDNLEPIIHIFQTQHFWQENDKRSLTDLAVYIFWFWWDEKSSKNMNGKACNHDKRTSKNWRDFFCRPFPILWTGTGNNCNCFRYKFQRLFRWTRLLRRHIPLWKKWHKAGDRATLPGVLGSRNKVLLRETGGMRQVVMNKSEREKNIERGKGKVTKREMNKNRERKNGQ